MISKELELILQDLYTHAKNARHELVGLEHLLLAIVQGSTDVNAALQHCGVETALLVVQALMKTRLFTPPTKPRTSRSPRWAFSA